MKLELKILSTSLFLVFLSYPARAGTTMQNLNESTEIVDMDKWLKEKEKSDEYAKKQGTYVYAGSYQIN